MYLIYDFFSPTLRYFCKSLALQEIPHTHMHLIPFIMPLAPLLKVDILTNLPLQDGSVVLFKYMLDGHFSALENVSGTSNEKGKTC